MRHARRLILLVIASLAAAAVLAGSLWMHSVQLQQVRRKAADNLAAIGRLKADQIAAWRSERIADASALTDSPLASEALRAALRSRSAGPAVMGHLRTLQRGQGCVGVLLADAKGEPLASTTGSADMGAEAREAVREALRAGRPVLTDLYLAPGMASARLDAVTPLLDTRTGAPLGAVVIALDAGRFIYPLIQTWPAASSSAETLLVRRDGGSVLFLNDLRHQDKTALRLRIPLTQRGVPAVMAALGTRGVFEGRDYRGVRVLSFITEIPDSPWVLVAKMDAAEAFSGMRGRNTFILLLAAAGMVTVVSGLAWIRQRGQKEELRRAYQAEVRERTLRSEREQATEALAASEEKLRRIIDGAAEGLVVVQDERIVMANPCARRLFGATAREVSEAHYLDYTWPEDRPLIAARTRARLAGERLSETVTYRLRTAAGQPVPVEAHATLIQWEGGTASLIFLTNIEERVRAEEERARLQDSLQESRRLEAIGLLAGGVAHDFNNMLAAILGYAELARDALPEGSGPRSDLDEIVAAAGRSRDLVRQLLAFASRQTLQMATLDLNAVVSGLAPMLRRTLREDVRIRLDLADSLPAIQGDRGQIEQVLLNLAVNAQDAMPGGGELVIETVEETSDNGCASERSGILSGRFVVMKVSDTGSGMDAETLERAFEPFFTTKGQGKGTGLGLPTVYGIMKQHQGSITAASAPGKGSVFLARFPACSDAAPAEARSKPRDPVRGAETVLVVEDQGQTRRLVCEMLRRNGYRVLEAADGESALAVAGTHDGEIDLVVTDVVMAGMNGKQLVERLREARPRTRVLFMSGYTSDIIGHHGVLEPGVQFIQKPFRLQDFTAKMREVLDRPGA